MRKAKLWGKVILGILVFIFIVAILQAVGIIKPESTEQVNKVENLATVKPTVVPTLEPTIEVSEKSTLEPTFKSEKEKSEKIDEDAIFKYYDDLLESKENPANWVKIGNEDFEINTKEYKEATKKWQKQCRSYEKKTAKKTAKHFGITVKQVDEIYIKKIFSSHENKYSIKFGELEDAIESGNTLVIKAKIELGFTNKQTINQNYFNIVDIIQNQGGNNFDVIDYWAVADMMDGSEGKVISFTVKKELIKAIYNKNIAAIQISDYVDDLYILESLLD